MHINILHMFTKNMPHCFFFSTKTSEVKEIKGKDTAYAKGDTILWGSKIPDIFWRYDNTLSLGTIDFLSFLLFQKVQHDIKFLMKSV